MADIHVQARRRPRVNPSWMWFWLIVGILIIATVVYYVYANKDENASNEQDLKKSEKYANAGCCNTSTVFGCNLCYCINICVCKF